MQGKKLYRSNDNRIIAGVAGGMAEYFNIDATVVRIIWVLLLLPGGIPGIILYLAAWYLIPDADRNKTTVESKN